MNWYAILTMATPLISLLGIEEIITLSRQAMEAEDNHPESIPTVDRGSSHFCSLQRLQHKIIV